MSKVQLQGNVSGTGIFTIASPNSNTDRTLTLPDNTGTILTSASTITQNNGPAFKAYANVAQTGFSTGVFTKVTFNVEEFDTANCFASSRFTPNVAGYYQINATLWIYQASATLISGFINLWKNGGWYADGSFYRNAGGSSTVAEIGTNVATVMYMNGTTDYVEVYSWGSTVSGTYETITSTGNSQQRVHFSGCLLRTG